MDFESISIEAQAQQMKVSKFSFLALLFPVKILHFILVLSCTAIWLAGYEPCLVNGMKSSTHFGGRRTHSDNSVPVFLSESPNFKTAIYGSKAGTSSNFMSTQTSSGLRSNGGWSVYNGVFAEAIENNIYYFLNSKNDLYELSFSQMERIYKCDFFKCEGPSLNSKSTTRLRTLCMQLVGSLQNNSDTIVLPIEFNLNSRTPNDRTGGYFSIYLDAKVPYEETAAVLGISLKSDHLNALDAAKISGITSAKHFATINWSQLPVELIDSPTELFEIDGTCKLLVLSNDTSSSDFEIPCQAIIHVHSPHQKYLATGCNYMSSKVGSANRMIGSLDSRFVPSLHIKELKTLKADDLVLGNCKSHDTTRSGVSEPNVKVLFPMVMYEQKWNPWPIHRIKFNLKLPVHLNVCLQVILSCMSETSDCSQPAMKELFAKDTGELHLEVKSIKVSSTRYQMEGFFGNTGRGFFLEAGESAKLLKTYQTDFSSIMIQKDLELAFANGYLVIPMKGSIPIHIISYCKKWPVTVLAASIMLLLRCFAWPQEIMFSFQCYFYRSEKSSISSMKTEVNSYNLQQDHRNNVFPSSVERNCLLRSVWDRKVMNRAYLDDHCKNPTQENHKTSGVLSPLLEPLAFKHSVSINASQPGNLTVRTGKEKRKRKKRKGGVGAIEVSSSQSGNSTPSSPLSPASSVTPSRASPLSPAIDPICITNPFSQVIGGDSEKSQVSAKPILFKKNPNSSTAEPVARRQTGSKQVLLHSAIFPGPSQPVPMVSVSSPLRPNSVIAPLARAPGSKLIYQKTTKVEQKAGDEYLYDIWGDHFSGLHFNGGSMNITTMRCQDRQDTSHSFFVRGPQAFITNSQQKYLLSEKGFSSQSNRVADVDG